MAAASNRPRWKIISTTSCRMTISQAEKGITRARYRRVRFSSRFISADFIFSRQAGHKGIRGHTHGLTEKTDHHQHDPHAVIQAGDTAAGR